MRKGLPVSPGCLRSPLPGRALRAARVGTCWPSIGLRLVLWGVVLVFGACGFPTLAAAQSLEPRAYANIPVSLNFALAGYVHGRGGVSVDPSVPLEDAEIESHTLLVSGHRSIGLWGRSGLLSFLAPYSKISGSAVIAGEPRSRTTEGFADPLFRIGLNLVGAPALTLAEYAGYRQDTIVGISLLVSAPLGEYDSSKLLNIGANRWSFKPEVGVSKAFGNWLVEGAGAVTLFTANRDYNNGQTREQEPIYSVQGHLIYSFRPGLWLALDATHYGGGRTTVDGDRKADMQQNWRGGVTLSLPITRSHSLKAYASTGVYTRTGSDFDLFGIAWQVRWGGGL